MVKGMKQTEIGWIPEDWKVFRLTSCLNNYRLGGNYLTGTSPNDLPLIKMGNIGRGKITLNKLEYINSANVNEKDRLNYGDILFNTRNTLDLVGKVSIWRNELDKAYYNSNLLKLEFNKKVVSSTFYINAIFNDKRTLKQLADIATGTTSVAAIYTRDLLDIQIPLPPLPEQEAIAGALSDADAWIESLEQLIAKKRLIKQGAMQELLTPKEDWEVKQLGEVCEIKKGQMITSSMKVDGNIPVIAGGKTPAYFHNKPNRKGKTITISASGASAGYIGFHNYPIFASDCSTINEDEKYCIEFLYYFLARNQEVIYGYQTGGAQPHIHAKDIQPMLIGIPSLTEQTRIATILSDMDAELEALEAQLAKARQVKQGMMQELLTGRIRLNYDASEGYDGYSF